MGSINAGFRWALLVVAGTGCGRDKEFAEAAVAAAEKELAPVRGAALNLAPAEAAVVDSDLAHARDQLERGDYRAAMKTAETAEAEARRLDSTVVATKATLTAKYQALAARVPAALAALKTRLDQLAKARALPAGVSRDELARVRDSYPELLAGWEEAADLFQAGDLRLATTRAAEVDTRLSSVSTALNTEVPPSRSGKRGA